MIFIVLATITSVLMLLILRLFEKYKVHTFYALMLNYFSAFVCGLINKWIFLPDAEIHLSAAAWGITIIEGILFITVFYWIAQTTRYYGMSVAAVANKMSLIFPVISAFILFNEPMQVMHWVGLLLALISVYLVSYADYSLQLKQNKFIIFPMLVFVGSGVVDTLINLANKTVVQTDTQQLVFTSFVYAFAFITGWAYLKIIPADKQTGKKFYYQTLFDWKSTILLGLSLGVPNYYNLFFIIQALNSKIFPSGQIFMILNLSNVIVSALVGVLLFKEKLKWINWLGILCAVMTILLMR
ncbi:MAG: DMT family transporter [Bacteroidota bacterium]